MTTNSAHPPIYFLTVYLNKEVHMIALSFTKHFNGYACAASPAEAEAVAMTWYTANGYDVHKVVASKQPAHHQDVNTYGFPHQIIDLPKSVLDSVYDRRNYPAEWREPGRHVTN